MVNVYVIRIKVVEAKIHNFHSCKRINSHNRFFWGEGGGLNKGMLFAYLSKRLRENRIP